MSRSPVPDPSHLPPTLPAGTPLTLSSLTTVIGDPGGPAPVSEISSVGNLLDGRYRVLDVKGGPGVSGMGVVYIVETNSARYAAKTFQHQFSQNLSLVERFLREARTWLLTGFHANIVHAYFIDIIDAAPYLFMEYVEPGQDGALSLADRLEAGPLATEEAVRLAMQCCDGMIHATSSVPGLVHRDLKPENLLIAADGTLKITDFGLVRCNIAEDFIPAALAGKEVPSHLTQVGSAFGTPAYMAPEQFVEAGAVNEAADIYAFGCCFYEAISGTRLFTFRADTPLEHLLALQRFHQHEPPVPLRERLEGCPEELDRVIMRCLEKDPLNRWSSFRELRDPLSKVLERACGAAYAAPAPGQPTAHQVASQIRSLTLLDGYHRAVRLRNLRETKDASPYAFHLALASYFHCTDEPEEERRQLEKALRVRGPQQGHEIVRRLGELLVNEGELDRAERLLNEYLSEAPDGLDRCLEPYVHLCVARGAFAMAEQLLRKFPETHRTKALLAHVYEAEGRQDELAVVLQSLLTDTLASIQKDIALVGPGDRVGWDAEDDREALRQVMAALAPQCRMNALEQAKHAVWPDLEAYPDFSLNLAWLSYALGRLSEIPTYEDGGVRATYGRLARILGYPDRLSRYMMRDERWFWTAEENEYRASLDGTQDV